MGKLEIKICNVCGTIFSEKYGCSHVTFKEYNPYRLIIDGNSLGKVIMKGEGDLKVKVKRDDNKTGDRET